MRVNIINCDVIKSVDQSVSRENYYSRKYIYAIYLSVDMVVDRIIFFWLLGTKAPHLGAM